MNENDVPEPPCSCPVCGGPLSDFGLGARCAGCLLAATLEDEPAGHEPVPSFGEYELRGELGRGGMGTVYRAEQARLGRTVALKMLLGGVFAQPSFLERFRREALAAAGLRHRGIAVVHDVGEVEGIAYYTMELLEGGSLEEWIASPRCGPRAAAELLEKTARAVAFAHEHGVLHRDLKPSNILLTGEGEPKVADFGLALLVEEAECGAGGMALTQGMLGTPAYMAPEVAVGGRAGISSDVYSLGAILYEALTGRPPHVGPNVQAVLARARVADVVEPRKLNPELPVDLATICRKCLDRETPGRYATAAELADDLARFLAGQPVQARPVGAAGHVWRWAKRNRSLAVLAAGFLLSVVVGGGLVVRQAELNRRQAAELEREHQAARELRHELTTHLYAADIRAASQEMKAGNPKAAWRLLQEHETNPALGVEWHWLARQTQRQPGRVLFQGDAYITTLSFGADGLSLAGADSNGMLFFLDPGRGDRRDSGVHVRPGSVVSLIDGQISYCGERHLESRPVRRDGGLGEATTGPEAMQAKWSADGRRAALCSAVSLFYNRGEGGAAAVWDAAEKRIVWTAPDTDVCRAAPDDDGSHLATAGRDGGVVLWNVAEETEVRRWDVPPVNTLDFSADGRFLIAGGVDRAWLMAVREESAPRELRHPRGHHVTEAAFSPDGGHIATACTDRVVRVWSMDALEEDPVMLLGHESEVWTLAWHPAGESLAGGGRDGGVLLWDRRQLVRDSFVPGRYQRAHFSPSGDSFIMAHGEYPELSLRRIRSDNLEPLEVFPSHFQILGITANDDAVLWNLWYHRVEWWPRGTGEPTRTVPLPEVPTDTLDQFALSPDGFFIARLDNDGVLEIRSLTDDSPPRAARVLEAGKKWRVRALAWSPDGKKLAAGTDQPPHDVRLVDASTLEAARLPGHHDSISTVDFSPDGSLLASGSILGDIMIWDLKQSPPAGKRLIAHTRSTTSVAFSRDGRTLLSLGSRDGVRFWHRETWRELAHLPIPDAYSHFALSPDESRLAVTCGDNAPASRRLRVFPLK